MIIHHESSKWTIKNAGLTNIGCLFYYEVNKIQTQYCSTLFLKYLNFPAKIVKTFVLPFSGKFKCCIAVTRTPKVSMSFSSALKLKDSCGYKKVKSKADGVYFWYIKSLWATRKSLLYLEGWIVALFDNFRLLSLHFLYKRWYSSIFNVLFVPDTLRQNFIFCPIYWIEFGFSRQNHIY